MVNPHLVLDQTKPDTRDGPPGVVQRDGAIQVSDAAQKAEAVAGVDALLAARAETSDRPSLRIPKREKVSTRPVPKGYETVDGIILTEPRIDSIRRELQALLKLVQLESDGKPIEVDGFQLRDIENWADSSTSLSDIFWHLSSVCNFRCEFCYEKGNPENFPIQNIPRMATLSEVDTRLKHYDTRTNKGVFTVRSAINEPFVNKNAVEVLKRMRRKNPSELLSFVTNGSLLSDAALDALEEMAPVFFNLSLYSIDPDVRGKVLGDPSPERAVRAVAELRRRNIPFMANIVMWPSISFDDMNATIQYLNDQDAVLIRVCLGGYSRYLRGDFPRFTVDEFWPSVVEAVENARPNGRTPLVIEPNSYRRLDDAPIIDGVIPGSPADFAGLRRGDQITAVNGKPIATRMQLGSAIRGLAGSGGPRFRPPGVVADLGDAHPEDDVEARFAVTSDNRDLRTVRLRRYDPDAMREFPYGQIAGFADFFFGLVITDGLQYSALKRARSIIEAEGARRTLVLTSKMMFEMVTRMAERSGAFEGCSVAIRAAENCYFGGSINIGDLLMVSDFVKAIQRFVAEEGPPDLVLVPSTPFASSPWERDLCGVPASEIERLTSIRTRLVTCQTITF